MTAPPFVFFSIDSTNEHYLLILTAVVLMTSIPGSGEFSFTRMGMSGLPAQDFVWGRWFKGLRTLSARQCATPGQLLDQSPMDYWFNSALL